MSESNDYGSASKQSRTSRGFGAVADDVAAVRTDLGKLKDDALHAAAGVAETGAEAARDLARKATDTAAHAKESVSTFITNRPVTSVLIAIGVGALAARVLMGRK